MVLRITTKDDEYKRAEEELCNHLQICNEVIPSDEVISNLGLFITPQERRREFFFYEVFKDLDGLRGSIAQFGVRWGREMALFESLRTIFEPFNHARHIYGFDTFDGYTGISPLDGDSPQIRSNNLSVARGYEKILNEILITREKLSPVSKEQKFTLVKGDVIETFPKFLEEHPWVQFALVHLDLNLYQPTQIVLDSVIERCTPGAIVILDEYNCKTLPGETLAIRQYLAEGKLVPQSTGFQSPTWPLVTRVNF